MPKNIKLYTPSHAEAVVQLALRAWAPVFRSLQSTMNADVYQAFYPDTWQASQQAAVEAACAAADTAVWLAIEQGQPVGFIAVKLHPEDRMGEIYMVAVDPDFQGRGIGTALLNFALDGMKTAGMAIAMVETGGEPGHASARHTYEKVGFEIWPVARYFKSL